MNAQSTEDNALGDEGSRSVCLLRARKKTLFRAAALLLALLISLLVGEVFVRLFMPQGQMLPRWQFSSHYRVLPYKNVKMVQSAPGRWSFTYTVNDLQYRGRTIPISNRYENKNIVVLGDSTSFGIGVNDGDEYPAVLARALGPGYDVVNLGVGGWGLTQQIRRYYEFGVVYQPDIVILQFCENDPTDNLLSRVTVVEGDRFVFRNLKREPHWFKIYLSTSPIQRSQLYNLIRSALFRYWQDATLRRQQGSSSNRQTGDHVIDAAGFYNELLRLFARELRASGVELIMIAINGQLDSYPTIREEVHRLDASGYLNYIEVEDWFELLDPDDYRSLEGHYWGTDAHRRVGENLAAAIESDRPETEAPVAANAVPE